MGVNTKVKGNIQILLVDDHQVVRDGLQHMLEHEEGLEVVGQGADGDETMAQIEKLSPDVVLMDIKMPGVDGIELTRQVKRKFPSCHVIMLTLYDQYLNQAIEAGASGYLLKDIRCDELARAIRQVYGGKIVTSESIKAKMEEDLADSNIIGLNEGPDGMVEELQLVLPPPIEANQLMRLSTRVESLLESRVLQVIGAWEEGTVMTIALTRAALLADILNIFRKIPEIERAVEEPAVASVSPKLLKKAEAIPKLKNRVRKTIFLTLNKN